MRTMYMFGFLVAVMALVPGSAFAVHLYLDTENETQNRLDTFYIPVRIDTQGDCINAVDVVLAYDSSELLISDIATGESILTLWTTPPTIEREEGRDIGRITFAGGVPGGYCGRVEGDPGRTDMLVKLVATGVPQALEIGSISSTGIVVEPATTVYLNDGLGTVADLTKLGVDIVLVQATTTSESVWLNDVRSDTIAPEYFDITLVEGPSVGSGHHYIAFSTTDKQSGIDHYEILETDPDKFGFLTWVPKQSYWVSGESPYILRDQKLRSKIMVKAVDKNGNERIAEYTPPISPLVGLTEPRYLLPVVVIVFGFAVLLWLMVRVIRARRNVEENTGYDEENHHEE